MKDTVINLEKFGRKVPDMRGIIKEEVSYESNLFIPK
jgi:hypothetical protein